MGGGWWQARVSLTQVNWNVRSQKRQNSSAPVHSLMIILHRKSWLDVAVCTSRLRHHDATLCNSAWTVLAPLQASQACSSAYSVSPSPAEYMTGANKDPKYSPAIAGLHLYTFRTFLSCIMYSIGRIYYLIFLTVSAIPLHRSWSQDSTVIFNCFPDMLTVSSLQRLTTNWTISAARRFYCSV